MSEEDKTPEEPEVTIIVRGKKGKEPKNILASMYPTYFKARGSYR